MTSKTVKVVGERTGQVFKLKTETNDSGSVVKRTLIPVYKNNRPVFSKKFFKAQGNTRANMRLSKNDEIELMKNILKQSYGLDQFRKMLGTDTQKETKRQIIKDPDHAINIMQHIYWRGIEISAIWCFWFIYIACLKY